MVCERTGSKQETSEQQQTQDDGESDNDDFNPAHIALAFNAPKCAAEEVCSVGF